MKRTILTVLSTLIAGAASAAEPIWDANKVELESQKLAEGVFAVVPVGAAEMAKEGYPIATTGGFVIGSDGVLMVESMLNERLNAQMQSLIRAETDLPVRYLVNTSFHGDHSYGNQYVGDDVMIIQHENTAAYIAGHLEADKAFMTQNFGEGRGIEDIQAVAADILVAEDGEISVDLGGRRVDIRDFGFAQTGGDLFVSVPEAHVLWTGNAVVAQSPALPWLLDGHLVETETTLRKIHDAFAADTRVIPGHGPVTGMDTIQWNIDYLDAVRQGVEKALAKGLSLEETVAEVKLEDFGGYALFGWVHPALNVPAAYADLK